MEKNEELYDLRVQAMQSLVSQNKVIQKQQKIAEVQQ